MANIQHLEEQKVEKEIIKINAERIAVFWDLSKWAQIFAAIAVIFGTYKLIDVKTERLSLIELQYKIQKGNIDSLLSTIEHYSQDCNDILPLISKEEISEEEKEKIVSLLDRMKKGKEDIDKLSTEINENISK